MDKNKNVIDIDIMKFQNNSDLNYASIAASMTENIKTDTKESFKDIELPEINSSEDLKNLDIKYSDCHDQIRSELDDIKNAQRVLVLIKKYIRNEDIDYYKELPDGMKSHIQSLKLQSDLIGPNGQMLSNNTVAKMLIGEMAKKYQEEMKKQSIDFDKLLSFNPEKGSDTFIRKMGSDVSEMLIKTDEERKEAIDANIKQFESEGKLEAAKRLQKIKDIMDSAYTLTDFAEFCKHCRIRKFEIQKPKKLFNAFEYKYSKSTRLVSVNEISSCPEILKNHLPQYTPTHKLILCIAFCKYCQSLTPDNIEDFTFMYYFIKNIILIDQMNPKGLFYDQMNEKYKKFYDEFTSNLSQCIFNLLERNVTLK